MANVKADDMLAFKVIDSAQNVVFYDTAVLMQPGISDYVYTLKATDTELLAAGSYSVYVSISRLAGLGKEASVAYQVKNKPYITVSAITPNQLQKPITNGQLAIAYVISGDSSITAAQNEFTLSGYSTVQNVSRMLLPKTAYLTVDNTIAAGQHSLTVGSTFTVTGYGTLQTSIVFSVSKCPLGSAGIAGDARFAKGSTGRGCLPVQQFSADCYIQVIHLTQVGTAL